MFFRGSIALITRSLKVIQMTQQELKDGLDQVNVTLTKVGTETTTLLKKIEELGNTIANNPVSSEVQAAFEQVRAQANAVDALVPDAPPAPPAS